MIRKTKTKMSNWDDIAARQDATLAFARYLKKHPNEVAKVENDSDYAKKIFAKGYFYLEGEPQRDPKHLLRPIPKNYKFEVQDFDPNRVRRVKAHRGGVERDNLVQLVLPDPNAEAETIKPTDIWMCTWAIWAGEDDYQ